MPRFGRTFLIVLLASIPALGAGPIAGPETVGPYKQVRLEATEEATSFSWLVFPFGIADGEAVEGGKRYVFIAPPGHYDVVLTTLKDGGIVQSVKKVEIVGSDPKPPAPHPPIPPPGPDPPAPPAPPSPDPTPDDGLSELTRSVWTSASNVMQPALHRVLVAKALALSHREMASKAGNYRTVPEFLVATVANNRRVLGNNAADWVPVRDTIKVQLDELHAAGKLSDVPAYAKAFLEIATGLEKVK